MRERSRGVIGNLSCGAIFSQRQNDHRQDIITVERLRDGALSASSIFIEKRSKPRAPRLNSDCSNCGELARLKAIEAFPFTRGLTEAVYKCPKCGAETRHALPHG